MMNPEVQNYATKMAIQELKETGKWGAMMDYVSKYAVPGDQVLKVVEEDISSALHVFRAGKFMQEVSRGKIRFIDIDVEMIAKMIRDEEAT
jgi:hypothetical protein